MYKVGLTATALALALALGACGQEVGTPGTGKPDPRLAITPGPDATAEPASSLIAPDSTPTTQDAPNGE
jgi:hypothetical protein